MPRLTNGALWCSLKQANQATSSLPAISNAANLHSAKEKESGGVRFGP
jgi:hypothetical protein